jgi:hypothetical protein
LFIAVSLDLFRNELSCYSEDLGPKGATVSEMPQGPVTYLNCVPRGLWDDVGVGRRIQSTVHLTWLKAVDSLWRIVYMSIEQAWQ